MAAVAAGFGLVVAVVVVARYLSDHHPSPGPGPDHAPEPVDAGAPDAGPG